MDLGLLQRFLAKQKESSGQDPDIGVKLPVLFQRLGLENIQARITDSVRCVLPPLETDAQRSLFQAVRSEMPSAISEETAEAIRHRFEAIGLTRDEADQQIANEGRQAEEFAARGEQLHTVMPQMMLFCSGMIPGSGSAAVAARDHRAVEAVPSRGFSGGGVGEAGANFVLTVISR